MKLNNLLIFLSLFCISLGIRMVTINQIGRTWDEFLYIEQGYKMVDLMKRGDFNNSYLYTTYDHPPLVKYLYGLAANLDIEDFDAAGNPRFRYDYTYARTLSAVIGSLAVVVVALIGWQFISKFTGILGGFILATLPFYVGLSQLVTAESFIMLIFSLAVYVQLLLLKKYSFKKLFFLGIITGIALQIKQSNVLLFPFYFITNLIWINNTKKIITKYTILQIVKQMFYIGIIASITFILFWPLLPFHLHEIVKNHNHYWILWTSPPEVFFGHLLLVPIVYFPVLFAITTPILVLLLFFIGLKIIDSKKKWIYYSLALWFFLPFIQSFYPWRQHGVRYIIQIYAPLSLIAALGFEKILTRIAKDKYKQILFISSFLIYLLWPLYVLSPYYLDYFNGIVGGTKGVYERKLFQIGWWGQGVREAGLYVSQKAKKNQKVGLALSPIHAYPYDNRLQIEKYDENKSYDFVVVNYYNILREGFDDTAIKKKYKPVYYVKADGAVLATVYQK